MLGCGVMGNDRTGFGRDQRRTCDGGLHTLTHTCAHIGAATCGKCPMLSFLLDSSLRAHNRACSRALTRQQTLCWTSVTSVCTTGTTSRPRTCLSDCTSSAVTTCLRAHTLFHPPRCLFFCFFQNLVRCLLQCYDWEAQRGAGQTDRHLDRVRTAFAPSPILIALPHPCRLPENNKTLPFFVHLV